MAAGAKIHLGPKLRIRTQVRSACVGPCVKNSTSSDLDQQEKMPPSQRYTEQNAAVTPNTEGHIVTTVLMQFADHFTVPGNREEVLP